MISDCATYGSLVVRKPLDLMFEYVVTSDTKYEHFPKVNTGTITTHIKILNLDSCKYIFAKFLKLNFAIFI